LVTGRVHEVALPVAVRSLTATVCLLFFLSFESISYTFYPLPRCAIYVAPLHPSKMSSSWRGNLAFTKRMTTVTQMQVSLINSKLACVQGQPRGNSVFHLTSECTLAKTRNQFLDRHLPHRPMLFLYCLDLTSSQILCNPRIRPISPAR
jgi:hypothetical protein